MGGSGIRHDGCVSASVTSVKQCFWSTVGFGMLRSKAAGRTHDLWHRVLGKLRRSCTLTTQGSSQRQSHGVQPASETEPSQLRRKLRII